MSDILKDIADEAVRMVGTHRRDHYGEPAINFARIARLWNAHLENKHTGLAVLAPPEPLTPADVAIMMILLKLARLTENPDHRDSVVDIVGYALCYGEIALADTQPKGQKPVDRALDDVGKVIWADGPRPRS